MKMNRSVYEGMWICMGAYRNMGGCTGGIPDVWEHTGVQGCVQMCGGVFRLYGQIQTLGRCTVGIHIRVQLKN